MSTAERSPRNPPPGVYWRHQTLWISFYVTGADGHRVKSRQATGAKSPREAAQLRAARMTEHARGERTLESRRLTVSEVLAAVVADYEANGRRSVATLRGHV